MRSAVLSVWAVILSVTFLQTAHGLQTDLIGLRAGFEGFSDRTIGLLMAGYYAGYSSGPFAGHFLVGRFGHVRVIAACALVAGAMIVGHAAWVTVPAWAAFRFVSGFALSLAYLSYESWINDRVGNTERGRVFSLYIIAQMSSMTMAQLLFSFVDPHRSAPFVVAAVLFAGAAVPVALGRRSAPAEAPPVPLDVFRLARVSPLGVTATVLAGTSWSIVANLGPVYTQHIGFDLDGIALWMGLTMAAGGLSQFPIGWLSDLTGRRSVIAGMFALGLAGALAGLTTAGAGVQLAVAAFVGLFTFPLYTVAVAHVNDPISRADRVAAASGLVFLFGAGSIAGSVACGWAMTAFGPPGFYLSLAGTMTAGLLAAARWR